MSPETEDDGEGSLKLSRTYKSDGTASTQSGDALRMSELNRQRTAMGWQYGVFLFSFPIALFLTIRLFVGP